MDDLSNLNNLTWEQGRLFLFHELQRTTKLLEKMSEQMDNMEIVQAEAHAVAANNARWWGGLIGFGTSAIVLGVKAAWNAIWK